MIRLITAITTIVLLAVTARAQSLCDNPIPENCNIPDTCCIIPLQDCPFTPGDINGLPGCTCTDVTYLIRYIKGVGQPPIPCPSAADINGDCAINGQDVLLMINYFKGKPTAPFKCTIYICPIF
jgi:hypothetical protein